MEFFAPEQAADTAAIEEKRLLEQAVVHGDQEALNSLIERYHARVKPWIAKRAAAVGLKRNYVQDVEDAQQEASFSVRYAILSYHALAEDRSLWTYVCGVVKLRFQKFARGAHRYEKGLDRTTTAGHVLDEASDQLHPESIPKKSLKALTNHSARSLEQRELLQRLEHELNQLSDFERLLCQSVCSRRFLSRLAKAVNMPCSTLRRWRQELLARLEERLRNLKPD